MPGDREAASPASEVKGSMSEHHKDWVIRIGGEGGEGVISLGDMVAKAAARAGLELFTFRTYPAEIKGGHAWFQLRVGPDPILSQGDFIDILVAFNQEGYVTHRKTLAPDGLLVYDKGIAIDPADQKFKLCEVPMTEIAVQKIGNVLTKNIVALGAISELLAIPRDILKGMIQSRFGKKGGAILEKNYQALEAGAEWSRSNFADAARYHLPSVPNRPPRYVISGNQALAFGALTAGCRLYAGYPITPASDILEWLARELPKVGGIVIQTEDEMAALATVIGSSYSGKKSMTASSGPGISLMVELMGLASMAEIPAVIVDAQRAGPSTGMPTKVEQSDLNLAVFGAHGEAPRIVLAPTSVEDCFYRIIDAFNLSETYQTPVLFLTDQALAQRTETMAVPDFAKIEVRERAHPTVVDLQHYRRYQLTDSGVAPMATPGTAGVTFMTTGIEHDESGSPIYTPKAHEEMSAKRHRKILGASRLPGLVRRWGAPDAEIGILGWGSTEGAAREAIELLGREGLKVAALYPRILNPLPEPEIREFVRPLKSLIVPELNYSGQLAGLLKMKLGVESVSYTKCQGVPIWAHELVEKIREVSHGERGEKRLRLQK